MGKDDLLNSATGYVAGNSIARGVAGSLHELNEEMAKRLAHYTTEEVLSAEVAKFLLNKDQKGAYEYLNSHLNEEIVYAAQNQNNYIYSLETILKKRKDKYNKFYTKIGMPMPENIANLSADELCKILGVENLHIIDSTDGKTTPSRESSSGCLSGFILGTLILFVIATVLSVNI